MFVALASLLAFLATAHAHELGSCAVATRGILSGREVLVDHVVPPTIPPNARKFGVYIPSECRFHQGTKLAVCPVNPSATPVVRLRSLNKGIVYLREPSYGVVKAHVYCGGWEE